MTTSKIVVSLDKWLGKRCLCLKCRFVSQQVGLIWWSAYNLMVICKIVGWCLIMSNMFRNGPPWLIMFKTCYIAKCSPLQFATCNLNPQKFNVSCGQKMNHVMFRFGFANPNFKGFMANSAHANWNVVCIMYGYGDASMKMVDKEQTCLFHWNQLLDRHTK
jgi:hypothetical protein